jgi:RNA polymerase sigma factor (sigma-70 family)
MADIPPTRASLLVRLRDRRDEAAWKDFVDLYAPLVYGYIRKQGLQDADAADLSQEVFRAVSLGMSQFEYDPGRGLFRNWLFTVVRRKLANWRRARENREKNLAAAVDDQILDQYTAPPSGDETWELEWERRVFAWACEQVRGEVAESSWRAFWRTAIDGQPGKEVAAELGLSVAAVYHARSRIRARLQELARSAQES